MAKPKAGESKDDFLGRCMSELQGEFPDQKQRYAACNSMWKESADDEELDDAEELDESNPRGINQYTKGIKAGTSVGPLRAGNLNKHAQAGRLRYKGKKVAKVLDAGSELSVYLHPGQGQARGAPYHVRPATAKREGSFSVSESEGGDALNEVDIADFIELNEVRFQRDGSVPVKVIQPGWGSSGFYSKELLESAAERFDGAQMYWNHPTPDEDKVRPERSLNDLAAILSNARYRESGPAGPGVYAFAKVFSPFKERIGELAPYIGVSILAQGRGAMGKADDKEGLIIESIDHVRSVDFVTKAGAGGRVVEMFEAAREPIVIIDESGKGGEEDMELKEALEELATIKTQLSEAEAKMAEQNTTISNLNEEVARAREVDVLREAKAVVELTISKVEGLPDVTKERLATQLAANPPIKDGALDKPVLEQKVDEAVKAEADYIAKLTKSGHITMGDGGEGKDDTAKAQESLKGAFTRMGLSEAAVNTAVIGRTH